jgi:nitrogen regulatory protein PII-like uncharacterized protein
MNERVSEWRGVSPAHLNFGELASLGRHESREIVLAVVKDHVDAASVVVCLGDCSSIAAQVETLKEDNRSFS